MTNQTFDFRTQLAIGNLGESAFMRDYHLLKPTKSTDYKVDFFIGNQSIELKSDTYGLRTGCYFMEYEVDGKEAGPWRAYKDGIDWFIFYFIPDCIYHWFGTEMLVKCLDRMKIKEIPPKRWINNRRWQGYGYLIDRFKLRDMLIRADRFQNNNIAKVIK